MLVWMALSVVLYTLNVQTITATTVLDAFLEGVSTYGCPVYVRSDHCGEHVECGDTYYLHIMTHLEF